MPMSSVPESLRPGVSEVIECFHQERPPMRDVVAGPQVVRFSVFELDLRAGELRKKGLRLRLQEQPLQVLALLLQQPGEVVTREELRQKVWTGGIIVDFDHSLN